MGQKNFQGDLNIIGTIKQNGTPISGDIQLVTWSELKTMRDGSLLKPGKLYRITDFVTTTTQQDSRSAGHTFDIVVLALDESTLSENAQAMLHDGDTYFASCKLEAWELKYCLDNDDAKFMWADATNGKGVIYYMKDEWNNECPYDFKNIQFKRYKITECEKASDLVGQYLGVEYGQGYSVDNEDFIWCYTFTWVNENNEVEDCSIVGQTLPNDEDQYSGVFDNKIAECSACDFYPQGLESFQFALNNIVIQSTYENDSGMFFGIYSNIFGSNCYRNTFGSRCYYNTFGSHCYYNLLGLNCQHNVFGNDCYSNIFGSSCKYNIFGNSCVENILGSECWHNTFSINCARNTFGYECFYNALGIGCGSNTLGSSCWHNTFGPRCSSIIFSVNSVRYVIFEGNCSYLSLATSGQGSGYLQNIHIHLNVRGSSTRNPEVINIPTRGNEFETSVVAYGSTEIVIGGNV